MILLICCLILDWCYCTWNTLRFVMVDAEETISCLPNILHSLPTPIDPISSESNGTSIWRGFNAILWGGAAALGEQMVLHTNIVQALGLLLASFDDDDVMIYYTSTKITMQTWRREAIRILSDTGTQRRKRNWGKKREWWRIRKRMEEQ